MALRSRNAAFAITDEAVEGVFEAPNPATEMVRCAVGYPTNNPQVLDDDTSTGGLDVGERTVGSVGHGFSVRTQLRGALTAGGVPDWDTCAKVCTYLPQSQVVVPAGGAYSVVAASSTTTVIHVDRSVDTDWPAADHALLGRVLEVDADGVGAGASVFREIVGYDVTGNDVAITLAHAAAGVVVGTTRVRIPVQRVYVPLSSGIPSGSAYIWRDGRRWSFSGVRGDLRIALQSGNRGTLEFVMQARGAANVLDDDAVPADSTDPNPRAALWKGGKALLSGVPIGLRNLAITTGASTVLPDDPNEQEGLQSAFHLTRDPQVTLNPLATLVANRATFAAFKANTPQTLVAHFPHATVGARCSIIIPRLILTNVPEEDDGGLVRDNITGQAAGTDRAVFVTLY
jgi:hypothetical protein